MNDVYEYDLVANTKIDWELGNEHNMGDRIKKCAACGADWYNGFMVDIQEARDD